MVRKDSWPAYINTDRYSIPQLQLYHLVFNLKFLSSKLHPHRGVVRVIILPIDVILQESALAHRGITNKNVLKDIVIVESVLHFW